MMLLRRMARLATRFITSDAEAARPTLLRALQPPSPPLQRRDGRGRKTGLS